MKILRLLNKKLLSVILFSFFFISVAAEEKPVDIWNIEKKQIDNDLNGNETSNTKEDEIKSDSKSEIYQMQSKKKNSSIDLNENLSSKEIKIYGLYDPNDYGLDINMWVNSDGDQLKNIFSKLDKINLSNDAKEIMNISMLTNAYMPQRNISEKDFLKFKSDWLIKNSDLDLIANYLIKNQIFDIHPELTKFLVNQHLSNADEDKACNILFKNSKPFVNDYISKFNIYCLVASGKIDEAQLILDLKKELGFNDKYFEKKIYFLMGYSSEIDEKISEKNILEFHLAYKSNPDFIFEPNDKTSKIIWKYLSSFNLLNSFEKIDITEIKKISTLEKATHNKNYPEKDLLNIYKRFQFNINQLLNLDASINSLTSIEGRALVYQKILLESDKIERLKLLKTLKNLFKKEDLDKAFDVELKKFLEEINPTDIPDNLTSFYYTNITIKKNTKNKIKFNNDVLHQSKLLNYFSGEYSKSKITKDVDNFLKKIKKNKKYFFSRKDQILLESLKSDGIEISDKYEDLFEINDSEIPTDIKVMINNSEKGAALLRIVEVIGQDQLERIDDDTIYFIISTLNQLNIGLLRNKILLKVLPLKV
jgi:hypothetical protein